MDHIHNRTTRQQNRRKELQALPEKGCKAGDYIEGSSTKCSSDFALRERKRANEDLNLRTASIFTIRALHLSEIVAGTSTLALPETLAIGLSFCLEWLATFCLIRRLSASTITDNQSSDLDVFGFGILTPAGFRCERKSVRVTGL
jgi:hypothetical protein